MRVRLTTEGGFGGIMPQIQEQTSASQKVLTLTQALEPALQNLESPVSAMAAGAFCDGQSYTLEIEDEHGVRSYQLEDAQLPAALLDKLDALKEALLEE